MEQEIKNAIKEVSAFKDLMDMNSASNKLTELSVLHASLTSEIAKSQNVFDILLNNMIYSSKSVAEAKIKANATPEHLKLNELVNLEKSLVECIRSLKIWIKIRANEYQNSFNM